MVILVVHVIVTRFSSSFFAFALMIQYALGFIRCSTGWRSGRLQCTYHNIIIKKQRLQMYYHIQHVFRTLHWIWTEVPEYRSFTCWLSFYNGLAALSPRTILGKSVLQLCDNCDASQTFIQSWNESSFFLDGCLGHLKYVFRLGLRCVVASTSRWKWWLRGLHFAWLPDTTTSWMTFLNTPWEGDVDVSTMECVSFGRRQPSADFRHIVSPLFDGSMKLCVCAFA